MEAPRKDPANQLLLFYVIHNSHGTSRGDKAVSSKWSCSVSSCAEFFEVLIGADSWM